MTSAADVLTVQADFAVSRAQQPAAGSEQGRFAAGVGADDRRHGAGRDCCGETAYHRHPAVAGLESLDVEEVGIGWCGRTAVMNSAGDAEEMTFRWVGVDVTGDTVEIGEAVGPHDLRGRTLVD